MISIPAIDIMNGKVVRLMKGSFKNVLYYDTDVSVLVDQYASAGASCIHIVDLDAARGTATNLPLIRGLAERHPDLLQVGGGVRDDATLTTYLDSGVAACVVGSAAVSQPETVLRWVDTYGPRRVVLAADVIDGSIATHGWVENSKLPVTDFIAKYHRSGVQRFLCTDVQKDGMLAGLAIDLYRELAVRFPAVELIASGGVSSLADIVELSDIGLYGVVIGRALLEQRIDMKSLVLC